MSIGTVNVIPSGVGVSVLVGPFVGIDGKTIMDSLIIPQASVMISKCNETPVMKNNTGSSTSAGGGFYFIPLSSVDTLATTYYSRLQLIINMPNCLPYSKIFLNGIPA